MSQLSMPVSSSSALEEVFARMQEEGSASAVVSDDGGVFGTVTDADLRCAVMTGTPLTDPVGKVVTGDRVPVASDTSDVTAVVLAGGRGQRLRPLTDKLPKPLLTVGRTTIVERLLEGLRTAGITEVYLAVNYKAEAFEERLGDGAGHGVNLRYLREREPLHTAGPLSLLPDVAPGPIVVMNADQVTSLRFARLVDFHRHQEAAITVGTFEHAVPIPYGVLRLEGAGVVGIDEKPTLRRPCNAGIYVVEPDVVALVPPDTFFGMPALVEAVLAQGRPVAAFPILEKFIDIGTLEELEAALVLFATGEEV